MTEIPILFNGSMVRAILDGQKTQTRRVIRRLRIQLRHAIESDLPFDDRIATLGNHDAKMNQHGAVSVMGSGGDLIGVKPGEFDWICPYAKGRTVLADEGGRKYWSIPVPDTTLWVRETWCPRSDLLLSKLQKPFYRADGGNLPPGYKWRPSIHMPKWASRLRLRATDVRVERVRNIDATDALAEGVCHSKCSCSAFQHRDAFAALWDSINAKRKDKDGNRLPYAWADSPWVWAITFEVMR